jgi:hypothetical protein
MIHRRIHSIPKDGSALKDRHMMKHLTSKQEPLVFRLEPGSRIVLIGLGGVGSLVLEFLALFLHSLRIDLRLVVVDGDDFQSTNISRMSFRSLGNKAEVKAAETLSALGHCDITIVPIPEYFTSQNAANIIRNGDYVFLCVDNHASRKLVSDHCLTLSDVALFSGGNEGVDPPHERGTFGNVQIALRQAGNNSTVPITHYHFEIAHPQGKSPADLSCGELALSTPQILFTNLAVASAMLNAFFAYGSGRLAYQEVQFDIIEARMLPQFLLPVDRIPQPCLGADNNSPHGNMLTSVAQES